MVETSTDGDVSLPSSNPSLSFIVAVLNNHPVRILIDTGASCSFIRASTLKLCRVPMTGTNRKTFWLADGTTSFTTIGTAQLDVRINKISTKISALVVRHLSCECILGVDWQIKHRVDVCHSAHVIRIHDENGRCLTSRRMNQNMSSAQFPVKLIAPICLQPYQECLVQASVPISSSPAVLFLPRPQLQQNKTVRTPDAVLSVDHYVTSLTIYNDSDSTCHLATGTLLGKAQLIDANTSFSPLSLDSSVNQIGETMAHPIEGCVPETVTTTIMSATSHSAVSAKT